jgi:aldehyde:ferredoxin oxidoreductase
MIKAKKNSNSVSPFRYVYVHRILPLFHRLSPVLQGYTIASMDHRCDDLGIDTIEMGAAIGVLNDVGLFQFGNKAQAITYLDEVAKGSPIGRILGQGVSLTAKAFGIDRVPAVKGQAIPAHTCRTVKGWG